MSSVDGHDATAHDLSQICRGVDTKGDDSHEHLAHVGSGKDDIIYNKELHHRRRAADDDEIELAKGVEHGVATGTVVGGAHDGNQRAKAERDEYGEERDDECVAKTLQQIEIAALDEEVLPEFLRKALRARLVM